MARTSKADARNRTPPRQAAEHAREPDAHADEYDAEGYYNPFAAAENRRNAADAPAGAREAAPPWEDAAPSAKKPGRGKGRAQADEPDARSADLPWEDEIPSPKKPGKGKGRAQADEPDARSADLPWEDEIPSPKKPGRGRAKADEPDTRSVDLLWEDEIPSPKKPGKGKGRAKADEPDARSAELSWEDEIPSPKKPGKGKNRVQADDALPVSASRSRRDRDVDDRARVQGRGARRASGERSAARDTRLTLTVLINGDEGDQFDLLCDGRAYGGGYEPPYRFELKLEPGEHYIRVRLRHALDRTPSEFVPLPLAMLLGEGRRAEYGPYRAVLDARIDISADSRLTVRYALSGRAGRSNGLAAFACSAGKGLECEVLDASMSTTPRLRRRWLLGNYLTLGVVALTALTVVGLGAYMCVRPGGSLGGGLMVALIGVALALGCVGIAGAVREALDGGCAPDIEMPRPKRKKSADAGAGEALPRPKRKKGVAGADGEAPGAAAPKGRAGKSARKADAGPGDYDGAYDGAGEMYEFEESGLSAADLSPEQLRAAKRQLLKKLGGTDEDG